MHKIPISVLVVIHTPGLDVLLIERADRAGFWQSVTGSIEPDEPLAHAAVREVREETGIDARAHRLSDWRIRNRYEIYPHWRARYAPGTTHNLEHVFGLTLPERLAPTLAPREHVGWQWLPWREAAERAFSWTNADAIRLLPHLAPAVEIA